MLSAWRKLTKKQDEKSVFPAGIAPVDQQMQKKFAKGVHYNMKIIIKGDRNTGKSTLLHRLTGGKFKEEYIPTHEIQVANVNWNYRGADDVVKVEVWDIVDKSQKKRTTSDSLKITNEEIHNMPVESFALDAELINVYKGTHGIILTMDITKSWTWQYVERELENMPTSIPVLVMANFRDMGDHRVVQADEIIAHLEHLERPTGSAEVYFSETSMKDGFGLKFIYKFLNMPFLLLQREALMRQLEANTLEVEEMREELSIDVTSAEQNYGLFKDMVAENLNAANVEQKMTVNPSPVVERKNDSTTESLIPANGVTPAPQTQSPEKQGNLETSAPKQPSPQPPANGHESPQISRFQAYKAKLFGTSTTPKKEEEVAQINDGDGISIDDFHPGQLDDNFLSGDNTKKSNKPVNLGRMHLDSDDNDGNPLVAGYEDLDSEDEPDKQASFDEVDVVDDNHNESDDAFDDLSDDERKTIETDKTSIIEQIKSSKNNYKTTDQSLDIDQLVASTRVLDLDGTGENNTSEHDDLDNDEVALPKTITTDKTKGKLREPHNKTVTSEFLFEPANKNSKSDVKQANIENVDVDKNNDNIEDTDDEGDNVYVVTTEIDVDTDWLNNNSDSEIENDEPIENPKLQVESKTEENVEDSSTNKSVLNFDLDALEMFMTNQLNKPTVNDGLLEVSNTDERETERPKKQKKKKTTLKQSDPSTSTEKKKKKKLKQTADVGKTATFETKKLKTAVKINTDREAETTKKSKSSDGISTKKKKKASAPAKSEYDAFFDE